MGAATGTAATVRLGCSTSSMVAVLMSLTQRWVPLPTLSLSESSPTRTM